MILSVNEKFFLSSLLIVVRLRMISNISPNLQSIIQIVGGLPKEIDCLC